MKCGRLHRENNRRFIEVLGVCGAAATAAAVLLALFLGPAHIKIELAGATALALAFALCGNVRLGLLWALVLTAPLGVSKKFLITPNMGGASALQIDANDVFLIPLLFLILREMHIRVRRPSNFVFPGPARWWLALIVVGTLTVAFGPYRLVASLELVRMFKLLLVLLVVANEVVRRQQFRHMCAALIISVVIQSSVAITQYILQRPLGLQAIGEAGMDDIEMTSRGTLQSKEFVYRVSAVLGHANILATFLAALLPLALALLFTRVSIGLRLLCGLALGLGGFALILTLSRTGWIAAAFTLCSVMVMTLFHPRLRVQFPLGRIGFVIGAIAIGVGFSGKIGARMFSSDEGAVDFRWEILEVAWKMGVSSPVLGVGLNSFVFQMPPFTRYGSLDGVLARFGENVPVVHNVYALVWAEMGAVGFVLFTGFCVHVLVLGVRCLRAADEEAYALAAAGTMGFIAFMLDWITSFTLRIDLMARVVFLIVGMLAALDRWRQITSPPPPVRPRVPSPPPAQPSPATAAPA